MNRAILFFVSAAAVALPTHLGAQATPAPAGQAKPASPATGQAKPASPASGQAKPSAAAARTIVIEANDAMKFSVTQIQAKPGERLKVSLKIVGKMPKLAMGHNFVLLKEGVDPAAFANDAVMAGATDYIPAKRKADIITATKLGGGGETVETEFDVPTKPGTYTFICSFPGHFAAGMRGTLVVK
jgi:azurin